MTHIFSSTQHCNQKEALTIILCAMVVAWNDMVMGREALPSGEQVLESNASKLLEVHAETLYETTQKAIADCEEDIERRKHRLISRMRDLVALRALSKEYKRYAASDADALLRDVQSLRRIPGVDDVRITDGCLELHSNDVVIEHKGKQHHLGRYTLRFTKALYPLVYAQTTLHPQGVMHPHIGPSGAVCFGNVTYAITEAAADYNYVRVAELVFGWLFNGYDEAIAETPVTEWPEVKQEGETADALAA
jgi:hypothetical protein